jgi:hypothetical protein
MAVNFSNIQGFIRGIDFSAKQIILYYDDCRVLIGYTTECCETSWFEQPELRDLPYYDENYVSFNDIAGHVIINIEYETDIEMDEYETDIEMEESENGLPSNHLYIVNLQDEKYSYILLRCSSNGYYDSTITLRQVLRDRHIQSIERTVITGAPRVF